MKKMLPIPTGSLCTLCLLLTVLAQFASSMKIKDTVEEIVPIAAGAHKEVAVFVDAEHLREFIFHKMEEESKITMTKVREVEIGLLASLFPIVPTEEEGNEIEQQQLFESKLKEAFEKHRLFDATLPDMILRRIDQLAQRPYMEELAMELDEDDRKAANEKEEENSQQRRKGKKETSKDGRAKITRFFGNLAKIVSKSRRNKQTTGKAEASSVEEKNADELMTEMKKGKEEGMEEEDEEMRRRAAEEFQEQERQRHQNIMKSLEQAVLAVLEDDAFRPNKEEPYKNENNFCLQPKLLAAFVDEFQLVTMVSGLEPGLGKTQGTLLLEYYKKKALKPRQKGDPITQLLDYQDWWQKTQLERELEEENRPAEWEKQRQRHNMQLYRALQAVVIEEKEEHAAATSSRPEVTGGGPINLDELKHLLQIVVVDELKMVELGRKVGIRLMQKYCETKQMLDQEEKKQKLEEEQGQLLKGKGQQKEEPPFCIPRGPDVQRTLYFYLYSVADGQSKMSSDPRFLSLKLVTKVRLFFYRWLYYMIFHLKQPAEERASLYYKIDQKSMGHHNEIVNMPTLLPGKAFQYYLTEWLQNGLLNPLGQQIMIDLIDHQGGNNNWADVLLPFCVHLSLRAFLNYAERLDLDGEFWLHWLMEWGVKISDVERNLDYVVNKLAQQGKTIKELVKPIREHIFENLPLLIKELPNIRFGIEQALQNAVNGIEKAKVNKRGDQQLLRQFFIGFYQELAKLASSSKWLQPLITGKETIPSHMDGKRAGLAVKEIWETTSDSGRNRAMEPLSELLKNMKISSTPKMQEGLSSSSSSASKTGHHQTGTSRKKHPETDDYGDANART